MSEHAQTIAALNDIHEAIVKLTEAIAGVRGNVLAEKKAKKESAAPAPVSTAEAPQQEEPVKAAVSADPAPTVTHDEVKALASLKAKEHTPAKVKALIAETGFKQIADIDTHAVLVSLKANLEAL